MKNIALVIIALLIGTVANAQLLASLTTSTEGGVAEKIENFRPQVVFFEKGGNLAAETLLFDNEVVKSTGNTTVFSMNASNGSINFAAFCNQLKNCEAILRVGHDINNIKTYTGRSVQNWFNTDLNGAKIDKIELIYTKVQFTTSEDWTDFSYEVTLNVYGAEHLTAQAK
jgi:hypothetical protein